MSIDWFKSWHGAPTDNKWLVIAKRANVSPGIVSAIVWALLDCASQSGNRGSIETFDIETYSIYSGFSEEQIGAVINSLKDKELIKNNRIDNLFGCRWFILNRPNISDWAKIRKKIFKRDNYTCQYCGQSGGNLECDHIHPFSKGGSHDDTNLATACFKCNRSKRDKTVYEWRFNK